MDAYEHTYISFKFTLDHIQAISGRVVECTLISKFFI